MTPGPPRPAPPRAEDVSRAADAVGLMIMAGGGALLLEVGSWRALLLLAGVLAAARRHGEGDGLPFSGDARADLSSSLRVVAALW